MLSLAAGAVLGADPLETIRIASAVGFGAVGLRLDSGDLSKHALRAIRASLADADLVLLDVEVLWLRADAADDELPLRLVDVATELGARHVLVVSLDPSLERTADRLRALCERAESSATALRVALEFPGDTTVRCLAEAVRVVTHAAHPRAAVLVDSLHLARTGGQPADLLRIPLGLLPYIQVCDAGSAAVSDDEPADMAEARGGRLLPGQDACRWSCW